MAPQVVYRDKGQPGGKGQPLGEIHPHQQCPNKPRGAGDGYAVYLGKLLPALGQGLLHHPCNGFAVERQSRRKSFQCLKESYAYASPVKSNCKSRASSAGRV